MQTTRYITGEKELTDLLAGCGFDFASRSRDIAVKFPKVADWDVSSFQILPFKLNHSFAGFGPVWKVPVNREIELDLPPTLYFHEFYPSGDARSNFDQALRQLTAIFGPGRPGQSVNVFERNWRFGIFTIQLICWPQKLNRGLPNAFEGRNPYLWIASRIYIQPDFPVIQPTEDANSAMQELLSSSKSYRIMCDSQVYARRNRVSALTSSPVVGLVAGAFLIRTTDRTVRVPLDEIKEVELVRLTPAQFSGSSSVSLNAVFLNRHQVRVAVAAGKETHSLDSISELLSQTLGKPLVIKQYPDER